MREIAKFELFEDDVEELLERFEDYEEFSETNVVRTGETPYGRDYFVVSYDDRDTVLELLETEDVVDDEGVPNYEAKYELESL